VWRDTLHHSQRRMLLAAASILIAGATLCLLAACGSHQHVLGDTTGKVNASERPGPPDSTRGARAIGQSAATDSSRTVKATDSLPTPIPVRAADSTLRSKLAFPAGSPYSTSAQTQSGNAISQNWSSGTLPGGASSQTLLVDKAGTYLFGCFYHYGGPMRAEIVAH